MGAEKEQEVPRWTTDEEKAVLDVVYSEGAAGLVALDVSVTNLVTKAARGGGAWRHALARRERKKHQRYPGPELVPFVMDVRGRWGREAEAWLRRAVRRCPAEERADKARECRYAVAVALQEHCAEQLGTCHGPG